MQRKVIEKKDIQHTFSDHLTSPVNNIPSSQYWRVRCNGTYDDDFGKKVVSLLFYSLMNVFSSGTHCLFTSKAESTSRQFSVRQRPKFSGFLYLQHLTDSGGSCPSPHSLRFSVHPSQLPSLSRLSSPPGRQRALDYAPTPAVSERRRTARTPASRRGGEKRDHVVRKSRFRIT